MGEKEAKRQPGRYHKMDKEFLALVRRKLERNEVHFLKAPTLQYTMYPGPPDPTAYLRVSKWLTSLGYNPLQLDDQWWKKNGGSGKKIIKNYRGGFHEYDEVMELLQIGNPSLEPVH